MADRMTWACGCATWVEGHVFFIRPCPNGDKCRVYQIAIEMSKKRGNEIKFVKEPGR